MVEDELILQENTEETNPVDTLREVHEYLDAREHNRKNNDEDPDKSVMPEEIGASVLKYHKGAEISGKLVDQFDSNVSFYGAHVVNSNTRRIDNLRHLGELDSTRIVRDIPYMRESGTDIKIRSTSEFQMCRSNPEIGGFDQKMGRTNITKEDVDLRQNQTINKAGAKKTGGLLSWVLPGRRKEA